MDDYDIIQGERTYQHYNGKPVYAFGHGLTYGEIRYEKMTVSRDMAELFVNVTISNNGRYTDGRSCTDLRTQSAVGCQTSA